LTSVNGWKSWARLLIQEITDGKFAVVDEWTISEPVPREILFGN
jgi:hypothetical protein